MANHAKVTLCGYLGRDVECRYTPQGTAVANFSLATTEKTKVNGENQEHTTWWRITAWAKQAELCNQYLRQGAQVLIEGRPRLTEFTDKEGNKRQTLEVTMTDVCFLGGKGDTAQDRGADNGYFDEGGRPVSGGGRAEAAGSSSSAGSRGAARTALQDDEDQIPF